MSKLFLIRHGQASFGKENYDELSDLGKKQAAWLGSYFKEAGLSPSRLITGSLTRHKETASFICEGLQQNIMTEEHIGWNEFDFKAVVSAYLQKNPELTPTSQNPKAFFRLLRTAMIKWSENTLTAPLPETWSDFEHRVNKAMEFSKTTDGDILVVSSGGPISMALKHLLKLDNSTMIDLNLQTRNTSISEIYFNQALDQLCSFNNTPHLDTKERRGSITYA